MSPTLRLITPDRRVESIVEPWLADARLSTPSDAVLDIRVGEVDVPRESNSVLFRQGRVTLRGDDGSGRMILDWGPGLGHADLGPGGTTAMVTLSEPALDRENELRRSFLLNTSILLLRRAGLHHVHAAALEDPLGRGWMIVGVSRAGKSTTSALLAKDGWRIGTDDIAFLTSGSGEALVDVVTWREQLALREDTLAAVGHVGGTHFEARGKTGWFPEEIGAGWVDRLTPRFLGFPRINDAGPTSVTPISAKEALSRLIPCSPWVALEPALADEHLLLMSALVTQARCFTIGLGPDLFERPGTLLELIS